MSYQHSNVYIVRVVDTDQEGTNTWFVGPYGSTRADHVADELESVARDSATLRDRKCVVEALYSDDECLVVADYGRAGAGSLY